MSSLSPNYVVPDAVIERIRPLWEAALDDMTPFVGEPIEVCVSRSATNFPQGIADAFGAVRNVAVPRAVILTNRDFADVRKIGRDVLSIGEDIHLFPLGVMAQYNGALVIANSTGGWARKYGRAPAEWVPTGTIFVVGSRGDGSWVRQEIRVTREVGEGPILG
jgi:hypothetical protein